MPAIANNMNAAPTAVGDCKSLRTEALPFVNPATGRMEPVLRMGCEALFRAGYRLAGRPTTDEEYELRGELEARLIDMLY